ncbi:MAG TPA: ATP-binding protein [Candidatus Pacearchaeota archaeon]|nr:ATP-binding protein [Candidatus Pacearchaeota archaeon]
MLSLFYCHYDLNHLKLLVNMILAALLALISGILNFLLAFFLLLDKHYKKQNLVYAVSCLVSSQWLFATVVMLNGNIDQEIIFWDRIANIAVLFIPVLMYHFSIIFSKKRDDKNIFLSLGYISAIVYVFLSQTDKFYSGVFRYKWGAHAQAGVLHHIWFGIFIFYTILFFINIIDAYLHNNGLLKKQAGIILVGFFIYSIAGLAILPAYNIGLFPISYLAIPISTMFVIYAILRYRFMDIGYVFGRLFVYISSIASILGIAYLIIFSTRYFSWQLPDVWLFNIILLLSLSIYPAIFLFFEKFASKYFYYTFYSVQQVLIDTGKRLNRVLEMDKLVNIIFKTISETMKVDQISIYLKNKNGKYSLIDNFGFDKSKTGDLVINESLNDYLEKTSLFLSYEKLLSLVEKSPKEDLDKLRNLSIQMLDCNVSLCLPLILEKDVVGIILLGPKMNSDNYSEQDEQLLSTLASQISLALINARNYSQLQTFNIRLEATVKKRTEELRKANENLQKADRLKSEFVSIASHQLRSPLTIIKGYLSVLLEGDYGLISEEVKKPLQIVFDANERLINFSNDLLDLNMMEEGKMTLNFEPVSLQNVIGGILKQIEKHLEDKKVAIEFIPPVSKLPDIQGDASKLEQVIYNLIDNAVKYSPLGKVFIKLAQKGEKQVVSIKDTGEGMTPDELAGLFEKFSRGKVGKKVTTKGSGIGLFIAKKFVEMHSGKIWAESEGIGKGSVFYVELPETIIVAKK